jgi:hypothetical protein
LDPGAGVATIATLVPLENVLVHVGAHAFPFTVTVPRPFPLVVTLRMALEPASGVPASGVPVATGPASVVWLGDVWPQANKAALSAMPGPTNDLLMDDGTSIVLLVSTPA